MTITLPGHFSYYVDDDIDILSLEEYGGKFNESPDSPPPDPQPNEQLATPVSHCLSFILQFTSITYENCTMIYASSLIQILK